MILARFGEESDGRLIEGMDRGQNTIFPECLEDWIGQHNPVRVIDAFVEQLDLAKLRWVMDRWLWIAMGGGLIMGLAACLLSFFVGCDDQPWG